MIDSSIPLQNPFSSLDSSQEKKMTTESEERCLSTRSPESSNGGGDAQKLPLDQRKSQPIPQTIRQNPSVRQSVRPHAQFKTTHAGLLAEDDQDESHRTETSKTLKADTDFITVKRKKKRIPNHPEKVTGVLPAKTTHYPEKPTWQSSLLAISEEYFNSAIKGHIDKKFLNKINCDNPFLRFRKLVNRPFAKFNEQDIWILSKLVVPLSYQKVPTHYRLCVLEFAIEAYKTAGSIFLLQRCGFNFIILLKIALAVEYGNKKNNDSRTSLINNDISVQEAQCLLQSMISLFEEVQKKREPGYFFTLLIPSETNYSKRNQLFSYMAHLLDLRGQKEALRVLMETEDIAKIDTWKDVLKDELKKYRKIYDEKKTKESAESAWTSINTASALMAWILYMMKQKDKAGAKNSAINLYVAIEQDLIQTLGILNNQDPSIGRIEQFKKQIERCESYSITAGEAKKIFRAKDHVERLKNELAKNAMNSEEDKEENLFQKIEKRRILRNLLKIIVNNSLKLLIKKEEQYACLDIYRMEVQKEVASYITDYQKVSLEILNYTGKQNTLSTSPPLSNRSTDSVAEISTPPLPTLPTLLENEDHMEESILLECCFKRICCTILKDSREQIKLQYDSIIKKKLEGIKLLSDKKELENISWLLLIDLVEAISEIETTNFRYPIFRFRIGKMLQSLEKYEEAINIYKALIPKDQKCSDTVTRQQTNSTPTQAMLSSEDEPPLKVIEQHPAHLKPAGNVELTPEKACLFDTILEFEKINYAHVYSQLAMCYMGLAESKKEKNVHLDIAFSYAIKSINLEGNPKKYAGTLQKIADSMAKSQLEFQAYERKLPRSLSSLARSEKFNLSSWVVLTQFLHFIRHETNDYDPREPVLIYK